MNETAEREREEEEERIEEGMEVEVMLGGRRKEHEVSVRGEESLWIRKEESEEVKVERKRNVKWEVWLEEENEELLLR